MLAAARFGPCVLGFGDTILSAAELHLRKQSAKAGEASQASTDSHVGDESRPPAGQAGSLDAGPAAEQAHSNGIGKLTQPSEKKGSTRTGGEEMLAQEAKRKRETSRPEDEGYERETVARAPGKRAAKQPCRWVYIYRIYILTPYIYMCTVK